MAGATDIQKRIAEFNIKTDALKESLTKELPLQIQKLGLRAAQEITPDKFGNLFSDFSPLALEETQAATLRDQAAMIDERDKLSAYKSWNIKGHNSVSNTHLTK